MRCISCKKADTMRPWEGRLKRMGVEFLARGMRCLSCGETLFSDDEVGRQEKSIAAGLVARGVRTGVEFKFVRKVAGLKAIEVATMLDVRAETVSRWESGEADIPRPVAFTLGELFEHPKVARQKLEAFAR